MFCKRSKNIPWFLWVRIDIIQKNLYFKMYPVLIVEKQTLITVNLT